MATRLPMLRPAVSLTALASALAVAAPQMASGSGVYLCQRATSPITVDGCLDEPAWASAEKLSDLVVPPSFDPLTLGFTEPRPATTATVARLLWNDDFLYLGVEMVDRDVYNISQGHDPPFAAEDVVELFIKPTNSSPFYWELHVTPGGATRDYFYARRGAGADARWIAYNTGMRAAVRVRGTLNNWEDADQGWTVEAAVPLAAFQRAAPLPKPDDGWNFMVSRYDYSVYLEEGWELSASAPLPTANFHLWEYYPTLIFR